MLPQGNWIKRWLLKACPLLQINSGNSSIKTLMPTIFDNEGGIYFRLNNSCEGRCKVKPFEWTSLDMRKSFLFEQDKYHKLNLCAKQNPEIHHLLTNEIYEFNRISALREGQRSNCIKLASGRNFVDNKVVRFQQTK